MVLLTMVVVVLLIITTPDELKNKDQKNIGAPQPTWEESVAIIEAEQKILLKKYGEYIQVSDSGTILYKNQPISENKFKNKIPSNTSIVVYDGPNGKGFQIIEKVIDANGTTTKSYAIGPEAKERTFSIYETAL